MGLLLLLGGSPPTIRTQPADSTKVEGTTALFTVVASAATGYQWQVSDDGGQLFSSIGGATSSSYSTPPLTVKGFDGNQYRAIVSNRSGSVISRAALLTVEAGAGPE